MKVMKFGGTSVADEPAIERLIAIVRAERQAEAQREGGDARGPIVVVSALAGVTDRLLGVAAQAGAGDMEGAHASLEDLRNRHLKIAHVVDDPARASGGRGGDRSGVRRGRSHRSGARRPSRGLAAMARHAGRHRRDREQPDRRRRAHDARSAGDAGSMRDAPSSPTANTRRRRRCFRRRRRR